MKPQLQQISVFFLLVACCHDVGLETFVFNIESVSPLNFDHTTIEFINGDNRGISATSYAMVFKTDAPGIKKAKPQKTAGGIFRSPDCSGTVDPIFLLNDQVAEIKITATEDFSPTYPAGSDLSELFTTIYITKDNHFSTPPSVIEYHPENKIHVQSINREIILYHEVVGYRNQLVTRYYGLRLMQQPAKPTLLQFKLEFILQSGNTMSGLTSPILLK